jgi:Domain of unknown function (DUF4397)
VKFRITRWRAGALLAALALMLGIPAAATASYAATSNGWISVGNLSQTPSAVDVYLYPTGSTTAQLVDPDVAYGTVLPAQTVTAGGYTVKMRTAGSGATSAPVWTASFTVQAGHEYTVVPLRTSASAGGLKVLDDSLTAPAGKSLVRVILADVNQNDVTFHCSCATGAPGNLVTKGAPGTVTPYTPIPPGPWVMSASGSSAEGSAPVPLTADTVRTEVVIGGPSGLDIVNLLDAAGGAPGNGGPNTGFGGTAPHGPASPLPWLTVIGVGALFALTGGGLWLRRVRPRRPAAQV